MSTILAVAGVEVRRFLRDRSNIFFVFIFPLLLILLLGSQFGAGSERSHVSVAGGTGSELEKRVARQLEADGLRVTFGRPETVRAELSRGRTDVGIFISDAAAAAFDDGQSADLEAVMASQSGAQVALQSVRASVQAVDTEQRQLAALQDAGVGRNEAVAALDQARTAAQLPRMEIVDTNDGAQELTGLGQFDLGAAQQLLLFVFLSSLTGAATLIQARHLGVISRMMSAPVTTWEAIAGQAVGRFGIAVAQGAYIMVGTALLFGVDWGNPVLAGLILAFFAAVAAAAAMVIGSIFDNDAVSSGVGVGLGLVLAGLGGSMVPPEFFTETLQTVSRATPHRWAYDAFAVIQRHDGGLADILPHLGVLAGFAAVLLALGAFLLQKSLNRPL